MEKNLTPGVCVMGKYWSWLHSRLGMEAVLFLLSWVFRPTVSLFSDPLRIRSQGLATFLLNLFKLSTHLSLALATTCRHHHQLLSVHHPTLYLPRHGNLFLSALPSLYEAIRVWTGLELPTYQTEGVILRYEGKVIWKKREQMGQWEKEFRSSMPSHLPASTEV